MSENSGVSVSGQAVTIGPKVYALDNIALATAQRSANLWTGIVLMVLGGLPVAVLLATGNDNGLCLGIFGAVAVAGLFVALFGGSAWWVYVETTQGKRRRIWSAPEARARALAEEINKAKGKESPRIIE